MNILEQILGPQGDQLVENLSNQFGIGRKETEQAVGSMLPSLTKSLKKKLQGKENGSVLLDRVIKSEHEKYWDDPRKIDKKESIRNGNDILEELFGSKARSRDIAGQAAEATGIDISILKQILPQLAGATAGGLRKQANQRGALEEIRRGGRPSDDVLGGMGKYLDLDNDGSVADDLMDLIKKFSK